MYNRFELGLRYINYFFSSSSGKGHGIHSPFVFDFVDKVLKVERPDKSFFNDIEEIRQRYEHQHATIIEVEDLGAGSFTHAGRKRTVSQIVRGAAKNPKLARLLYRIVRHYKIDSVLELGTSLGLTTRYLSRANPTKGVQTIEGATGIANFTNSTISSSAGTGAVQITGGVGIQGQLNVNGAINKITSSTASTSTSTGALIIAGGIGIAENAYVGGNVNLGTAPTASTHAASKAYVDSNILAFSMAFGV
jgi:hypothetical protein